MQQGWFRAGCMTQNYDRDTQPFVASQNQCNQRQEVILRAGAGFPIQIIASSQHPLCKLSQLKYLDAEELYSCCVFGVSICLSVFLSLIQCLCACHVTPGPATNWVSSSFSFLPLNLLSHYFPSLPPLRTTLHRCLSVALSTAWSVPLSAGRMVVSF